MNLTTEGYLTEEIASGPECSANKSHHKSVHSKVEVYKSVVSTVKKDMTKTTLRRSKTVENLVTPGPRAMMKNAKTPAMQPPALPGIHESRSKYRTPMSGLRSKAASADNLHLITPKVNPGHPFSMMRHPRAGEPVYSLTGSPIVTSK